MTDRERFPKVAPPETADDRLCRNVAEKSIAGAVGNAGNDDPGLLLPPPGLLLPPLIDEMLACVCPVPTGALGAELSSAPGRQPVQCALGLALRALGW